MEVNGRRRLALVISILVGAGCAGAPIAPTSNAPTPSASLGASSSPAVGSVHPSAHESPPTAVHTFGHPSPSAHASAPPHGSSPPAPTTDVEISVDGSRTYQTFDGFGGTLTIFEQAGIYNAHDRNQPLVTTATQAQRQGIADLLYGQLGTTRLRVMLSDFEPSPGTFDWTGSATDAEMAFVNLARPSGLATVFWEFAMDGGPREQWLRKAGSGCALEPAQVGADVDWIVAGLLHARDAGLPVDYTGINNEPDLCPPGYKIEIADFVTIVKQLGARLRSAGLATRIVVSDGFIPQNAVLYMRAVLSDADARQYVGALATHAYDAYGEPNAILQSSGRGLPPPDAVAIRQELSSLAEQYSLPLWMTEVCYCVRQSVSEWDYLRARLNHIHDELTIANVAAFDVMNAFFIEREGIGDELVHIYFRSSTDGTLDRFEVAPYGYLIGQYAAAAPSGSVRTEVTSGNPAIRPIAFVRPDGKIGLIILNDYDATVRLRIMVAGALAPSAAAVSSSADGAINQSAADVTFSNGAALVDVPPLGVVTLIGK